MLHDIWTALKAEIQILDKEDWMILGMCILFCLQMIYGIPYIT